MKLSIIIPVFNEEKTIIKILDRIKKVKLKNNIQKEIIIVDDYSSDKTRNILKKIKNKNIKIFYHEKNYGKGRAIRTGLKGMTGDFVIIQDADLEYNPEDYNKLLEPVLNKNAKVVYGSRILGKNKKNSFLFYLGGRFLTILTNILYGTKITDEATCYKLFSKEVIEKIPLKCEGFEFCPEITSKVAKRKIKIEEVPISYDPRGKKEGKKIKSKDGIIAIWTLLKYRFVD